MMVPAIVDVHVEAARYAERRLENALKPVEERLQEWGRWTRHCGIHYGWPHRTALGRVIDEGPRGAAQPPAPTVLPTPVMEVDAAVAKLKGIRQQVLWIAYAVLPNSSSDSQRGRLNMSRYRWRYLLRESRLLVAALLGFEV